MVHLIGFGASLFFCGMLSFAFGALWALVTMGWYGVAIDSWWNAPILAAAVLGLWLIKEGIDSLNGFSDHEDSDTVSAVLGLLMLLWGPALLQMGQPWAAAVGALVTTCAATLVVLGLGPELMRKWRRRLRRSSA